MPSQDSESAESIRAFLRRVTRKECLAWFKQTQDDRIRDALKPLLFDEKSGSVRHVKDRSLRAKLLRLVLSNDTFRRFLEGKIMAASLDRITAAYVEEQMEGL